MKFRAFIIPLILLGMIFGLVAASTASGHGWRHGKSLSASEIKHHPTWLKMPEHICNRDFQGDIAVTYDDDLGWVIFWICACKPHPNGITYICWWRPIRVLPENISNRRILNVIHDMQNGHRYTTPRFRQLGYVFRVHARTDNCHWHDEDDGMVIWSRYLGP